MGFAPLFHWLFIDNGLILNELPLDASVTINDVIIGLLKLYLTAL